jgi:predicted metalloprotease with PDZ domain
MRLSFVLLLMFAPAAAFAQRQSVDYDISFPNAAQHEALVTAVFHGVPANSVLHVRMAESSPGRYAMSVFAKNVYDVAAFNGKGKAITLIHPDPHGWDVSGHDGTVRLAYKVWGDRTDGTYLSIDHSHAHLNIPATFAFARGMDAAPIKLTVHPAAGWRVATQLVPTADPNVFTAPNFQWFMDSPTEVGPVTIRSWTETHEGKPVTWRLAVHHLGTDAQVDSFTTMVRSVVDEEIAMWGEPAGYDFGNYTFLIDYLPWANGDGMEHRNSTVISSRNPISDRAHQLSALGTVSHEFFHSWNMERLRSKGIEPFDFEREDMSEDLWFGEGFTNYYGPLMIRRAGLYDNDAFLRNMGGAVVSTINSTARQHNSPVGMSTQAPFFDGATYLDPTAQAVTFLSYYTWGSVVAMGLDLTLRSQFGLSLDDYMRALWRDYGQHQSAALAPEKPYTRADLRSELAKLTRDSAFANDYFRRYVDGREVPDFAKLLPNAGFLLQVDSVATPWLGASLDNDTASVFVNWSAEGSSMYNAGMASGDIIYAVDGIPAPSIDSLMSIMSHHKVGDVVKLDVTQRTVRRTVPMTLVGRKNMRVMTFEAAGKPIDDKIRAFRKSWLESHR